MLFFHLTLSHAILSLHPLLGRFLLITQLSYLVVVFSLCTYLPALLSSFLSSLVSYFVHFSMNSQLLDKNALMSLVKEALGVDEVLCTYFDSLAPLRGVFEKYSMSDGVVETMTVR